MILATWLILIVESWIFFFTCAASAAVSFSDLLESGFMGSILHPSGSPCQLALQAWPQVGTMQACHTQLKRCNLWMSRLSKCFKK